jgi:hypothetical protein
MVLSETSPSVEQPNVEPGQRSTMRPSGSTEKMPAHMSPKASASMPPELEYARSDLIAHEWIGSNGARVTASFRVSYSMPAGQQDLAAETMNANWTEAVEIAQLICENADLFDEQGRTVAEELLCRKLTQVLFAGNDGDPLGKVERVIWSRLMWR